MTGDWARKAWPNTAVTDRRYRVTDRRYRVTDRRYRALQELIMEVHVGRGLVPAIHWRHGGD